MWRSHWFNHHHQIAHPRKPRISDPLLSRGIKRIRNPGHRKLQIHCTCSSVGRAPDLSFSGPSFESRSVCMVSHYFSHNGTCTIPSVCCKFFPWFTKVHICDHLFCRTYYLLEQWMELSEGGTSGIPRPPSVTSEVIPWLSGESRSHYQK